MALNFTEKTFLYNVSHSVIVRDNSLTIWEQNCG